MWTGTNLKNIMNTPLFILLIIESFIGFGIHIEKIKRVKSSKPVSWELEIYFSVTCIIFLILNSILDVIDFTCPNLSGFVGFIFQFVVGAFRIGAVNIIILHSSVVGFYKYYIILIKRPMVFDNKYMDRKWLIFLVILPILWTCLNLFRDIHVITSRSSPITSCFQSGFYEKATFLCGFKDSSYYKDNWTFLYITTQLYCILQSLLNICFAFNIFEAFLYFKIFRFMRR